jgi:hypothetical protein
MLRVAAAFVTLATADQFADETSALLQMHRREEMASPATLFSRAITDVRKNTEDDKGLQFLDLLQQKASAVLATSADAALLQRAGQDADSLILVDAFNRLTPSTREHLALTAITSKSQNDFFAGKDQARLALLRLLRLDSNLETTAITKDREVLADGTIRYVYRNTAIGYTYTYTYNPRTGRTTTETVSGNGQHRHFHSHQATDTTSTTATETTTRDKNGNLVHDHQHDTTHVNTDRISSTATDTSTVSAGSSSGHSTVTTHDKATGDTVTRTVTTNNGETVHSVTSDSR